MKHFLVVIGLLVFTFQGYASECRLKTIGGTVLSVNGLDGKYGLSISTDGQTWQENTGVADHLQQEKNEGQPLTGPLQMWQKVYQCPTSQAIGLAATRLLSLPRQDY